MRDRKYIDKIVDKMPYELNLFVFKENAENFISSLNSCKMRKNRGDTYKLLELSTDGRKHLESCINFINSLIEPEINQYTGEYSKEYKEYTENLGRWLNGLDEMEGHIGTKVVASKSINLPGLVRKDNMMVGFMRSLESGFDNIICQSLFNARFLFNHKYIWEDNNIILEIKKDKDLFGWFLFKELLKSITVFGTFTRKGEYTQRILPMFPKNTRTRTYQRREEDDTEQEEVNEQEFTIPDPFTEGGDNENTEIYQQPESI